MKSLRFLPFLAACLSFGGGSRVASSGPVPMLEPPEKNEDRRKRRKARGGFKNSFFGHRWSWHTPHIGAKQAAKLARRAELDAKAAANNPAWRGGAEP